MVLMLSRTSLRANALLVALCLCFGVTASAQAQAPSPPPSQAQDSAGGVVDRVVARFSAPEIGGPRSPRFIYERRLAFEARLVALSDRSHKSQDGKYRERHLRGAMERHIAETLLGGLDIVPAPTSKDVELRVKAARLALLQRIGGQAVLAEAARAEGIEHSEIVHMMRRQARASIYLDRMVTPMLRPSEAELRNVHRGVSTPYSAKPFRQVAGDLRRWYVANRLASALASFYENARSRLRLDLVP